jgi:hypothetical protein
MALSVLVLFAGHVFADEVSDRAKLVGAWQPQEPATKESPAWTVESKGSDVLKVTRSAGDQKLAEFECSTSGRECEMKDSGKSGTVSMWFNGSMLVELETKGKEVIKRRFSVADQGNTLEIEVIPIVPGGKTETLRFRRMHQ